jgi:stress-induced-phosphoprotein 1
MQSILQQAKGDPKALNEHMRNPKVRSQVQKLVAVSLHTHPTII